MFIIVRREGLIVLVISIVANALVVPSGCHLRSARQAAGLNNWIGEVAVRSAKPPELIENNKCLKREREKENAKKVALWKIHSIDSSGLAFPSNSGGGNGSGRSQRRYVGKLGIRQRDLVVFFSGHWGYLRGNHGTR